MKYVISILLLICICILPLYISQEAYGSDFHVNPLESIDYNYGTINKDLVDGILSLADINDIGICISVLADGNGDLSDNTSIPMADITLFAQGTVGTYTVSYNANGGDLGSVPAVPTEYSVGANVMVLFNSSLSRTGYTFAGWNNAADGSGAGYAGANTFPMPASNVTLYAQWTVNQYQVSYDANGATMGNIPATSMNYNYGSTVAVLANAGTLVRTGYAFAGWNTLADGTGIAYAVNDSFSMPAANITLYARWISETPQILDKNKPLVDTDKKDKMRLAVIDFQAKGVSQIIASAVSDIIRSEMVDTGRFIVVERNQMDAILKEHEFQQTGCTDSDCAVQVGKMVSANKVLIGEVNQLGSSTLLTVRIVDVEKNIAEYSSSERAASLNDMEKAGKSLVQKLTMRMTGQYGVNYQEIPRGYYLRGALPGYAQIYSGNQIKGWAFAGAAFASVAFSGYAYYDYYNKQRAYNKLDSAASNDEFDSKYTAGKKAAQLFNISIYILSGIYLLNWVDVLFFNDYQPSSASAKLNLNDDRKVYFSYFTTLNESLRNEVINNLSITLRY